MDLRQLEYVVAVADRGGFTRAASSLRVSQPSLSHGVRSLEIELGVELFRRAGRGVSLTSAGEVVVDSARQVLRSAADLRARSASVSALTTGRLTLVALPTLAADPLALLIGRFRSAHPGVMIEVSESDDATSVERQVVSGRAELGFTDITVGASGLARVELFRQAIVAVLPPGSDRAGESVSASMLARLPLIATPPGTSTRRLLDQIVARARVEVDVVVEIAHREAIVPLVLAGAGAALLPESLARAAAERGAVVRPLRPALSRRIGIVHRRGVLAPAADAMLTIARSAP